MGKKHQYKFVVLKKIYIIYEIEKEFQKITKDDCIIVNLSGRGYKDINTFILFLFLYAQNFDNRPLFHGFY